MGPKENPHHAVSGGLDAEWPFQGDAVRPGGWLRGNVGAPMPVPRGRGGLVTQHDREWLVAQDPHREDWVPSVPLQAGRLLWNAIAWVSSLATRDCPSMRCSHLKAHKPSNIKQLEEKTSSPKHLVKDFICTTNDRFNQVTYRSMVRAAI